MHSRVLFTAAALVLNAMTAGAVADAIYLRGAALPIRPCRVEDLQHGRVYYTQGGTRREWRELEEVERIDLDALPQLASAEDSVAQGAGQSAIRQMAAVLVRADTEIERLWCRVRLIRLHVQMKEPIAAAAHAAELFRLRDDPAWRHVAPSADLVESAAVPDVPGPVAAEAKRAVAAALRTVRQSELVSRLRAYERALAIWPVPSAREETISGIPLAELAPSSERAPNTAGPGSTRTAPRAVTPQRPSPAAPAAPDSRAAPLERDPAIAEALEVELSAIEKQFDAGDVAAASARMDRLGSTLPEDHPSVLYLRGRAFESAGRPGAALLRYTRCGLVYPRTRHAIQALLGAARIYAGALGDRASALRLIDRAEELAEGAGASLQTIRSAREQFTGKEP